MRLFFLCGLFAMSMAQAEVLSNNAVQQIASIAHENCMKSDTAKSGWKADELASICGCAQKSIANKLRNAQFSNADEPAPADVDLLKSTRSKAMKECVRAQQESQIINSGVPQCMSGASTNPKLRDLSKDDQEAVCACTAILTARLTDFDKLNQMDKASHEAGVKAVWATSFDECAKK